MNKFRFLFVLIIISFFSLSFAAFSANSEISLGEVFGRARSSTLYYTAARMGALGYGRYNEMFNSGYSNTDIQLAMMQDFQKKIQERDTSFTKNMLNHMRSGAYGFADENHGILIERYYYQLFGPMPIL